MISLAAWLNSWIRRKEHLLATAPGAPGRTPYAKRFPRGHIILGAHRDHGTPTGRGMYTVVVVSDITGVDNWTIHAYEPAPTPKKPAEAVPQSRNTMSVNFSDG